MDIKKPLIGIGVPLKGSRQQKSAIKFIFDIYHTMVG